MNDHTTIVDRATYDRAVAHFAGQRIALPTFAQLAKPASIGAQYRDRLAGVDPDAADAINLFRVHWYNDAARTGLADVPAHVVLPESLTGVSAPIVVVLGDRFPMIHAHKVLPAYACLVSRLVTGRFDPSRQRALWPSTGNYCRGGVAISRIMGCRGVDLPAGIGEERFEWLERWVTSPATSSAPRPEQRAAEITTRAALTLGRRVGSTSSQVTNYLAHYAVSGRLSPTSSRRCVARPRFAAGAFVSTTGSAGTLGAGDWLKGSTGRRSSRSTLSVRRCSTTASAAQHQGIGTSTPVCAERHNTDAAVASPITRPTSCFVLFNVAGHALLARMAWVMTCSRLPHFGLSASATSLPPSRRPRRLAWAAEPSSPSPPMAPKSTRQAEDVAKHFGGRFDAADAAETLAAPGRCVHEHVLLTGSVERNRIFNLGFFTWVSNVASLEAERGATRRSGEGCTCFFRHGTR
jgi:hypothetical protein